MTRAVEFNDFEVHMAGKLDEWVTAYGEIPNGDQWDDIEERLLGQFHQWALAQYDMAHTK